MLISEPIANPLVPQFDKPEEYNPTFNQQEQLIIDGVIRKLDEGNHPWGTPTKTHLLDVMAGATLIALRLACKANHLTYPDDVFREFLPKEIKNIVATVENSWDDARLQHEKKKKALIKALKEKRKEAAKLPNIQEGRDSSGDPDPSMDIGMCLVFSSISFPIFSLTDPGNFRSEGGGDHGARGSGDGQGSSSLRTLGSGKVHFRLIFIFWLSYCAVLSYFVYFAKS